MTFNSISSLLPLIIVSIIYIIVILLYRNASLKANQNDAKFLYLNLRVNNHNRIKDYKNEYKGKITRLTMAFVIVILLSFITPLNYMIIVNTMLLITYIIFLHYFNNKYVKKIKADNLNKKDYTSLIRMGGFYYNNPEDSSDVISSIYINDIPNMARPFGKRMYIIVVILLLIIIISVILFNLNIINL